MQYHQNARLLTIATDAAVGAARKLGPEVTKDISIWQMNPRVLHFEFRPASPALEALPRVDLSGYLDLMRRQFDPDHPFAPDREELDLPLRYLHWLIELTQQPWAFWFHCGDNGLIYEYTVGLGRGTWIHFNDDMFVSEVDAAEAKPASSLTAALWYLGIPVANRSEAHWLNGGLREIEAFSLKIEAGVSPPQNHEPVTARPLPVLPEWLRGSST